MLARGSRYEIRYQIVSKRALGNGSPSSPEATAETVDFLREALRVTDPPQEADIVAASGSGVSAHGTLSYHPNTHLVRERRNAVKGSCPR